MGRRQPRSLYDQQRLRQISKDHSLVQRLDRNGQITAEEARIITNTKRRLRDR